MQGSRLKVDKLLQEGKNYLDSRHPLLAFPLLEKAYNLSPDNNTSKLLLKASYNGIWGAYGEYQFEFMEYLARLSIQLIDDISQSHYDIDLYFKKAKAYNGLAIALYNLGKAAVKYNIKASNIYDDLISKLDNTKLLKDVIKSKIKNDFGLVIDYGFNNNFSDAINYAMSVINISRSYNLSIEEGLANKVLGSLFLYHNRYNDGFQYLKKAVNCFIGQNTRRARQCLGNIYIIFCESYFKLSMVKEAKLYLDYSSQVFEALNDYPYKYYALLGRYYETIGDREGTKTSYLHVVSLLNVSKWGIKLETNVDSFLDHDNKEDIYLKAISILLDDINVTANIEKAFELLETFKSKLFMENTLLGKWNSIGEDIPLSLLRERQGLIKSLNKLYSKKDYLDNIDDINSIEKDLYYCDEKIALIKGGYKAFIKFDFNSLTSIQGHIPDSGMVLEYFYYDNKVYMFLISNKTFDCIHIDYPAKDLEELIIGYLDIIKKGGTNGLIDSFYESKIFEVLVSPVLTHLDNVKELIIIPYNILHSFPIHSLFFSYKEELLISYLPNLQSIRLFKSSLTIDNSPMIIGDPRSNLEGSLEEVNTIKDLFYSPFILHGKNATKEIIIKEFAFHSIIHYSGHIRYNLKRPLYSYLECSQDENNNASIDRSDIILLKEIYRLNLENVQFLSLSGCSSGLSTRYKGEELVGLVRGFFYAGVKSILATMWDVEDQSTKDFMVTFFKKYIESANKKKAFNYAYNLMKDKYKFSLFYGGFILYEGF